MKKAFLALALAAASSGAANASVFDFSYATQSGVTASGTIKATDLGGFYVVDDVSGSRNGAAITGYDFFDPTPQTFNYAGGRASIVDFSYYVGLDNYEIRWPGNGSNFGTEFRTDVSGGVTSLLVTGFSLSPAASTAAVPEPATWGMMIFGFAAVGFAMRRRAKVRTRVRFA